MDQTKDKRRFFPGFDRISWSIAECGISEKNPRALTEKKRVRIKGKIQKILKFSKECPLRKRGGA